MELYPEIKPFRSGHLKVSDTHEVYFEEVGNPKGQPLVFVHGGPGGGISEKSRRYFNPDKYHILLFDQRGSGKSKPFAEIKDNTTWDLVADMSQLMDHCE